MTQPSYVVRVFDGRRRSATSGSIAYLLSLAGRRQFGCRERAKRWSNRGEALRAAESLPQIYAPEVEQVSP